MFSEVNVAVEAMVGPLLTASPNTWVLGRYRANAIPPDVLSIVNCEAGSAYPAET
jgi:hypothetical protein